MLESLVPIAIVLFGWNFLFVTAFVVIYFGITRRRAKVYLLVEHLAELAGRGMPLQTGLRMVALDLGGIMGTRLRRAARLLEEGSSLAAAFEASPRGFPPLLRSMIALGERSGNLAAFLSEMRRSYRRIVETPHQAAYFFLYPVLLTAFINIQTLFLGTALIPKFQVIMEQLRISAPILDAWPWIVTANQVLLISCVALTLLLFTGGISPQFSVLPFRWIKRLLDSVIVRLPLMGGVVRDGSLHSFALATGLLLRAGAGLHEAVRAAAEAEPNGVLRKLYLKLAAHLAEGGSIASFPGRRALLPEDFLWFVETGGASGGLPEQLLHASAHYDTRVRFGAQVAQHALVPLFVLVNGAMVLMVFLVIFVPIIACLRRMTPL